METIIFHGIWNIFEAKSVLENVLSWFLTLKNIDLFQSGLINLKYKYNLYNFRTISLSTILRFNGPNYGIKYMQMLKGLFK